eukprot:GILJ01001838.1.p1 GENE.GILJ01001838.1~~GILJ01001838.1.p1  ORF type:complete len:284 (-),score=38.46 GILJ01001838.1:224-1075(-)
MGCCNSRTRSGTFDASPLSRLKDSNANGTPALSVLENQKTLIIHVLGVADLAPSLFLNTSSACITDQVLCVLSAGKERFECFVTVKQALEPCDGDIGTFSFSFDPQDVESCSDIVLDIFQYLETDEPGQHIAKLPLKISNLKCYQEQWYPLLSPEGSLLTTSNGYSQIGLHIDYFSMYSSGSPISTKRRRSATQSTSKTLQLPLLEEEPATLQVGNTPSTTTSSILNSDTTPQYSPNTNRYDAVAKPLLGNLEKPWTTAPNGKAQKPTEIFAPEWSNSQSNHI